MSETVESRASQGGDEGGVSCTGRLASKGLTQNELRALQRHIKRYGPPEEDLELSRQVCRDGMHDEHIRNRLAAVELQLTMLESDRKEELHAIEMEERLRALESEAPTQPAQPPGVTITGPVQINQQQVGDVTVQPIIADAVVEALRRSANRQQAVEEK